jgi:hypothetical protein
MAAATGATGVRSWLAARHLTWLTPKRMRVVTIGLMAAALIASSVTVSGSTGASHPSLPRQAHVR